MVAVSFRTQIITLFVFTNLIDLNQLYLHDLMSHFSSDMASLFRLGARAVSRQPWLSSQTPARIVMQVTMMMVTMMMMMLMQSRAMGSDPYSGMPPTTTLGGQFKNPV